MIQIACAILHAISCSNSFQVAQKLAVFINEEEEEEEEHDFIAAVWWYTLRLRFSAVSFLELYKLLIYQ